MRKRKDGLLGSIRQKTENCFELSYTVDGKRTSETFQTEKAAQARQLEVTSVIMQGKRLPFAAKITVAQWLNQWYDDNRSNWALTTQKTYKSIIRTQLIPQLGKIKLKDLTREHCAAAFKRIAADNKERKSLTLYKVIFKAAIAEALKRDYIAKDPTVDLAKCIPPKQHIDDDETVKAFDPDEIEALKSVMEGTQADNLMLFMLGTGMRIGEALALRWSDIDAKAIHVRRAVTGWNFHTTKNKKTRTIPLNNSLRALLERQKAALAAAHISAGEEWQSTPVKYTNGPRGDLIFTNRAGEILRENTVNHRLKALCVAANIRVLSSHALRHTFATRYVADMHNDPRKNYPTLSRILGHKSVAFTMSVYVDPGFSDKQALMDDMSYLIA